MIDKRNAWITLVFIILDFVCVKGLMLNIKDARFILGLFMCIFLTIAFARRIKIKPQNKIQNPENSDCAEAQSQEAAEDPAEI